MVAADSEVANDPASTSAGSKKHKSVGGTAKGRAAMPPEILADWRTFGANVAAAEASCSAAEGGFAFVFREGALLQAVREGWWLLLDEINLAPPEVRGEERRGLLPRAPLPLPGGMPRCTCR